MALRASFSSLLFSCSKPARDGSSASSILGKVLFVDEAYRLGQGHFAQEAIDGLVGLITHPKSKLIIILAGYEQDMNDLMSVNTGLSSRFPDQVVFTNLRAGDCLQVVLNFIIIKDRVLIYSCRSILTGIAVRTKEYYQR